MDHPVVLHNNGVVEIDDPAVGRTEQIGPLVKYSDASPSIAAPAPLLGQHDAEPLPDLPAAPPPVDGAPPSAPPLEGMTILDFSTWLAAPVGTTLLAGLGARVIKIEPPGGDEFRPMSNGLGFTFQGKESVVIDLKTEEGRAAVHKLVAKADALMHNMRGQAPERCGIDYETVRTINPSIIYHYAGSYGSTGPGAGRAAFHPIGGALSGGQWWQVGTGQRTTAQRRRDERRRDHRPGRTAPSRQRRLTRRHVGARRRRRPRHGPLPPAAHREGPVH